MAQNITERAKDIVNEALANVPAISVECPASAPMEQFSMIA